MRTPGLTLLALGGAALIAKLELDRRRRQRRAISTHSMSLGEAMQRHAAKVDRLCRALRAYEGPGPLSLRKRAVSHEVPKAGDLRRKDHKVNVEDLNSILHIDPIRRVCIAEPGVTFVDLVAATMRHGLVPAVVPELKTITIGGAVSGCSLESSSFQYGGFHDSCLEYELVTGEGEVLSCTPDNENRLEFQMVHGSFGTLGVLSLLKFKLLPCKPFVHVVYERYETLPSYLAAIRGYVERKDADLVDGIIHSPTEYVLSVGRYVDEAPYTHAYDWNRVYHRSTRTRAEDYLETPDYFFRYDHGVTTTRPRTAVGRLLFGKLVASSELLRLADRMHWALGAVPETVTVDVFVPMSKAPEFLEWYQKTLGHFPLWCVPYRLGHVYEWLSDRIAKRLKGEDLFLDLAIYGMVPKPGQDAHRELEQKLLEVGGIKTLISQNSFTEEEFWSVWNRPNYDRVKQRTDPRNLFRNLYAKTNAPLAKRRRADAARSLDVVARTTTVPST
jgi:FAD/FMN-containing dehydrogenase